MPVGKRPISKPHKESRRDFLGKVALALGTAASLPVMIHWYRSEPKLERRNAGLHWESLARNHALIKHVNATSQQVQEGLANIAQKHLVLDEHGSYLKIALETAARYREMPEIAETKLQRLIERERVRGTKERMSELVEIRRIGRAFNADFKRFETTLDALQREQLEKLLQKVLEVSN